MRTLGEVNHQFTPVGKLDPAQSSRMLKVQMAFQDAATTVFDLVPEGSTRTRAMNALLDAKFLSVQAITHDWPQGTGKAAVNATKKS